MRSKWWILLLVMFFMIAPVFAGLEGVCWRDSYGRGVGTVPTVCSQGNEFDSTFLLCYPACKEGYKGVGPVCWEKCPKGYTDDGVACGKGFFFKDSYGRGVGTVPKCKSGEEKDALLCYKKCKEGYSGVGPVCWGSCPADKPVNCGAACAKSPDLCFNAVANWITQPIEVSANFVLAVMTMGTSAGVQAAAKSGVGLGKAIASEAAEYAVDETKKTLAQQARMAAGMGCGPDFLTKVGGKKKFKDNVKNELTKEAKARGKEVDPDELEIAADQLVSMAESCLVPFDEKSILLGLDPTGIAELVDTFACKICKGSKSPTPCPQGTTSCGKDCCAADEACVDGQCVPQTHPPLPMKTGDTITLQADNGKYLGRVNRGSGVDPVEAAKASIDQYSKFIVTVLSDDQIALQADNGKYLGRVNRGSGVDPVEAAKASVDQYSKFKVIVSNLPCPQGTTSCGKECCEVYQACVNGECRDEPQNCLPDQISCGSKCCIPGEVCVNGRCVSQTTCPQGTFSCGNDCCNTADEKCANSQCLPKDSLCPPGMCKAHEVCVNGQCVSQTGSTPTNRVSIVENSEVSGIQEAPGLQSNQGGYA